MILICAVSLNAQTTYEKIDTISKSKNQIYSDTKMYIAENWKSAQNVIQNDNKEDGLILIKGTIGLDVGKGLKQFIYNYSYTVKFYMKDNKYKILIDNINPDYNQYNSTMFLSPPICENCEFPGVSKAGMYKDTWLELQSKFPLKMKEILISYDKYLRSNFKMDF